MPSAALDSEIMETVKEISPSAAYLIGFNDYAGRLFISSEANIRAAQRRVRALRRRATTEVQRKVLDSIDTALSFEEPQPVLDDVIGSIFNHLVKEGINEEHMLPLLHQAVRTIEASEKRFSKRQVPAGVKVLTLYRLQGLAEILDTVRKQAKSKALKAACDAVEAQAAAYVKMFQLEGFGRGEFKKVEKVFKRYGSELGRQSFYLRALRRGFDYKETPEELERNAIAWIDEELPRYRRATAKLAKQFGCKSDPQEVESKINGRMKLNPKELLKVTLEIRKVIQRFANEDVHGINPKYRTTVMETPDYLSGIYPTGAAQFFDTFTKKPFQIYFQTTDPKRDPDKSVAALINLLVHEEYGHCVHHSNSVVGFVGKVPALHLLPTPPTTGPITEGLSFNRELEFLEASLKLEKKKHLTKAEKDYVRVLEKYGGLAQINSELEFMTRRWRMVRFLRVVGDVRVNTGKQSLLEFLDWANEYTGVPRSSMYNQLFPAHEGAFPGYATSYAVVGQELRAMESRLKDDRQRYKFSTYLCSIGFPPRSIYRQMLRDYVAKLR